MSFKYFLNMAPEEEVSNANSLTKFRKLRLKDLNLLDMLIHKTVSIGLEKGIIKSKANIVDATHTRARYNQKKPCEILRDKSKLLRKAVYKIDETVKDSFPKKNTEDDLEKEIAYSKELIQTIKDMEYIVYYPKVEEKINQFEELLQDNIEPSL